MRQVQSHYSRQTRRVRPVLTWSIALAACAAPPALHAQAPPQAAAIVTCINPASGATWQISIDYRRATVDSNPARISDTEISWHNPKDGGNYTLNRVSGALTVIVASSTGGYFIHDRCRLNE